VDTAEAADSLLPETLSPGDTLTPPDTLSIADTISIADTLFMLNIDPEWDSSFFFDDEPEYNLLMSADRGQLNLVEMLVSRGVDVDASTKDGVSSLMYAAQYGDTAMVRYLIESGSDLDMRPDNGISALTGAVRADEFEVVRILIKGGADADLKDNADLTALMHASAYNFDRIVRLLAENGAGMEMEDWFGTTPLMMAVYYDCFESALELLGLGADINAQDTFGFTSLMMASQHGDYDMAWMLLDKGADPGMQNRSGQHALSMAVMNGHEDIIELLIENGADMNQNITASSNALNLAREEKKDDMVVYLKQLGVRKNLVPEFSGLRFGASIGFNFTEVNYGITGGISESKYNSFATTGLVFRPNPVRILRPENDTLSYQYWEKRFVWPVTIGKQLRIYSLDGREYGIRFQGTGALTWGSYRGSDRHPVVRYRFIPSLGMYWRNKIYGITFDYEYMQLDIRGLKPHRFRLGIEFYIDMRKRTKFTYKHIDWF